MKNNLSVLFRNPIFVGFVLLYVALLFLLHFVEGYSLSEPLAFLVILGFGFSGLAWMLTRSPILAPPSGRVTRVEFFSLLAYLAFITLYLSLDKGAISNWTSAKFHDSTLAPLVVELIQKVLFFVLIPLLIFSKCFRIPLGDLGFNFNSFGKLRSTHLKTVLGMSLSFILFNYLVGRGGQPIREGMFSPAQLMTGLPISYLWLVLEVGLVEEFFFRALVQSRLSLYLKSEVSGLVLGCLVFGLAHAPGLYLRGSGSITPIGEAPSILLAVGYSVVTLSIAGLCFGIIWARTKNLALLVLIHASVDLVPSFSEFAEIFNI